MMLDAHVHEVRASLGTKLNIHLLLLNLQELSFNGFCEKENKSCFNIGAKNYI